MAKAVSLKLVPNLSQKAEVLANVRKNVEEAVSQLRSLGAGYERAAWMLEDSLQHALSENESAIVYSDQGVDWASYIQAEELYSAR